MTKQKRKQKVFLGQVFGVLLFAATAFLTGCFNDDGDDSGSGNPMVSEQPKTIAEIASSETQFSTLVSALQSAGLVETLQGEGPFTVFAPTNAAFDAVPKESLNALLADPDGALKNVLLYHVVPGAVGSDAVVGLDKAVSASGGEIGIQITNGKVMLNQSATVIQTDIEASNGIIHVIDAVILPPEPPKPTIAELAAGNPDFSTLLTALKAAKLDATLMGEGPFTVFAPTNAAFNAVPKESLDALLADPDGALKSVLLYHVVPGAVSSNAVAGLDKAVSAGGAEIGIQISNGNVMLNQSATVIQTDIEASNGIIHVIDAVILPPSPPKPTIAEIAAGNPDFSTLLTALKAAKLDATLMGEGPFTVFAPTNAAFNAVPKESLDALLADPDGALKNIILYHVVPGAFSSNAVAGLNKAVSAGGAEIGIKITNGKVMLNQSATVIQTDIEASNGIIHVIDAVILPPAPPKPTIAEIAAGNPDFSTLLTALKAAKLDSTLMGEGPFTVFAPTNAAFNAVPKESLNALLADPDGALKNVLLYHVVPGAVSSNAVAGLNKAVSAGGAEIGIQISNGKVMLNQSATVIQTDIEASNGVIHVIDKVILPPAN